LDDGLCRSPQLTVLFCVESVYWPAGQWWSSLLAELIGVRTSHWMTALCRSPPLAGL
jgi:hypothetical protein